MEDGAELRQPIVRARGRRTAAVSLLIVFSLVATLVAVAPASATSPTSSSTTSTTEASTVLAHELAHQWFGDSVSLTVWSDIWLNEGFATYAEWLWDEHAGGRSLATAVEEAYSSAAELRRKFGPVAQPRPADLFSENVYDGGALVLAALRRTVGDTNFTTILHTWAADHAGRSATTAEFERLAIKVSGMDLRTFFDSWLRSTKLPPLPN